MNDPVDVLVTSVPPHDPEYMLQVVALFRVPVILMALLAPLQIVFVPEATANVGTVGFVQLTQVTDLAG